MTAKHGDSTYTLSDGDLGLLKRLFSNPTRIPPVFRSWIVSYVETNAQVTQGQVIIPPYTAWTPTLPADVDVGAGSATGHYIQIGNHVHLYGSIVFGSGLDPGSSAFAIPLPVTGRSGSNLAGVWTYSSFSPGPATEFVTGVAVVADSSLLFRYSASGIQVSLSGADPWTAGSGDTIDFSASYESGDPVNYVPPPH